MEGQRLHSCSATLFCSKWLKAFWQNLLRLPFNIQLFQNSTLGICHTLRNLAVLVWPGWISRNLNRVEPLRVLSFMLRHPSHNTTNESSQMNQAKIRESSENDQATKLTASKFKIMSTCKNPLKTIVPYNQRHDMTVIASEPADLMPCNQRHDMTVIASEPAISHLLRQ